MPGLPKTMLGSAGGPLKAPFFSDFDRRAADLPFSCLEDFSHCLRSLRDDSFGRKTPLLGLQEPVSFSGRNFFFPGARVVLHASVFA